MNDLFSNDKENLSGLHYIPSFLTKEQELELLAKIDTQPWMSVLKRRVQHYGYIYDYKKRSIDSSMYLGPLPTWLNNLSSVSNNMYLDMNTINQVIINEYLPGQGIASHIDCEPCFGPEIFSISLGADVIMNFSHVNTDMQKEILLQRRSLLILTGESRYLWKHEIKKRQTDNYLGSRFARQRRVSLTCRTVIL